MKFKIWIVLFLLLCNPFHIFSDINVEIIMPELGDGMSQIDSLLSQEISGAISELENTVTDALEKPLVIKGFTEAAIINSPISILLNSRSSNNYSFSLGGSTSIYSETLDYSELTDNINGLTAEDDFLIGINGNLISSSISIPHFLLDVAYLDFEYQEYFVSVFSIKTSVSTHLFKDYRLNYFLVLEPILLQAGIGYGKYSIGANIKPGVINEVFDIDIDGDGPLPGESVEIDVDPEVNISMDTEIISLNFVASSFVSIFDTLSISIGSGVNIGFYNTDISVATNTNINVLGYLSGLIETPGAVKINGNINGEESTSTNGYIFITSHLQLSSILINSAILYHPNNGLGIGFSCGVVF